MSAAGLTVASTQPSPARATLPELIGLRAAGESLNLAAIRVRALREGGHLSPFRGRGVEYDESRLYQPGDDLRTMDWRVTARTGEPHTKVFRDERDRPVLVWLDMRRPMHFATRGVFKSVRAAQMAALISWSAVANGDRLGGLVFSEREHVELRPGLGRRAALRLFRSITQDTMWSPEATDEEDQVDVEHALSRLTRVARPGSLLFLLSDFRNLGSRFEQNFRQLASHCDIFVIHFFDPVEVELPPPGYYRIHAGQKTVAIDTDSETARHRYEQQFAARREHLLSLEKYPSVHLIECATTGDPRAALAERFENR
ncbi:MAG TPA: DUF58 domain-containing protein [Gammaproteobacteria bacterium]